MESIVPTSLCALPEPWRDLNLYAKTEMLAEQATRTTALEALDRCWKAVGELPDVSPDEFPDFVTIAWSLWAGSFAMLMPSFDEFRLETIAESFRRQDPDITDELVYRFAQIWLRERALMQAKIANNWLFKSLRDRPDSDTLDRLRCITERNWQSDLDLASSLFHRLWILDPSGTAALLENVAASADAPKEFAARLRELLVRKQRSNTGSSRDELTLILKQTKNFR